MLLQFTFSFTDAKKDVEENSENETGSKKDKNFKNLKRKSKKHRVHGHHPRKNTPTIPEGEPLLPESNSDYSYYSYEEEEFGEGEEEGIVEEEEDQASLSVKSQPAFPDSIMVTNGSAFILTDADNLLAEYEIVAPNNTDEYNQKNSMQIVRTASQNDALMAIQNKLNEEIQKKARERLSDATMSTEQFKPTHLSNEEGKGITSQSSINIPSYITDALRPSDDESSSSSELSIAKLGSDL